MSKVSASQPILEANPAKSIADLMKPDQTFTFEQQYGVDSAYFEVFKKEFSLTSLDRPQTLLLTMRDPSL